MLKKVQSSLNKTPYFLSNREDLRLSCTLLVFNRETTRLEDSLSTSGCVESRDTVSLSSEFLSKSALRDEFKLDFTAQVLLLEFRILTNIRGNKLFDLIALQEWAESI